jgi:hypothetical protein
MHIDDEKRLVAEQKELLTRLATNELSISLYQGTIEQLRADSMHAANRIDEISDMFDETTGHYSFEHAL